MAARFFGLLLLVGIYTSNSIADQKTRDYYTNIKNEICSLFTVAEPTIKNCRETGKEFIDKNFPGMPAEANNEESLKLGITVSVCSSPQIPTDAELCYRDALNSQLPKDAALVNKCLETPGHNDAKNQCFQRELLARRGVLLRQTTAGQAYDKEFDLFCSRFVQSRDFKKDVCTDGVNRWIGKYPMPTNTNESTMTAYKTALFLGYCTDYKDWGVKDYEMGSLNWEEKQARCISVGAGTTTPKLLDFLESHCGYNPAQSCFLKQFRLEDHCFPYDNGCIIHQTQLKDQEFHAKAAQDANPDSHR